MIRRSRGGVRKNELKLRGSDMGLRVRDMRLRDAGKRSVARFFLCFLVGFNYLCKLFITMLHLSRLEIDLHKKV